MRRPNICLRYGNTRTNGSICEKSLMTSMWLCRLTNRPLKGGIMGIARIPLRWHQQFEGGRVFVTAAGHTPESFNNEAFQDHLAGGIAYVLGNEKGLDYSKVRTRRIPDESRFSKNVLIENPDEPTELEVLGHGKVLFTQRKGRLLLYDPTVEEAREVGRLDVHTKFEDGLMGLALDPRLRK